MAKRKKTPKSIETIRHSDATRKNIPTAEYQPLVAPDDHPPATYPRNRDLDPQLMWRGKDEQDWSDLVVPVPPLYIQEKIHPKVLIDDLQRISASHLEGATHFQQLDMFADFNGLPSEAARTEFYQHDANWSNRMILGDSLQVMALFRSRQKAYRAYGQAGQAWPACWEA
jgi:adenine-specific DNA-methyltransferase